VADYTPEQIAKIREETEKLNKQKAAGEEYDKLKLKINQQILDSLVKTTEQLNEEIEAQKKIVEGLGQISGGLDASILKQENILVLHEKELGLLKKQYEAGEGNRDLLSAQIKQKKEQIAQSEKILKAQQEINKEAELSSDFQKKITDQTLKLALASKSGAAGITAMAGGLNRMADSAATSMINTQISSIDGLLKAYDGATTSFEKQYALGEVYQDQIKDLYKETNELGASIEDVTKAYGELATGFTDFTMLAEKQREAIADTAITMERAYGIAQGDFAKGMQNASKMMGMTAGQAETYQRELAATAEALGVPPAQLASQFASMGPQFAKFGNQAGKAFKDLARISKITGMELEKVLAITNKFDTFEGAAEQAGQLNAALGGNFVNAMDLMMATDPAERFEMIRDAIMSTGLTFDDMSYYQKQFYTNALGLSDVGDLALMMSGNMDTLGGATNATAKELVEQKQRAADLMTIQEELNAAFLENAEIFLELIPALKFVAKYFKEIAGVIGLAVIAYKGISLVVAAYQGIQLASIARGGTELTQAASITGAKKAQAAANLELAASLKALNAAQKKYGNAMKGASKGAKALLPTLIGLGIAAVGIGAGIGLAATGVAKMAESLKELNGAQLFAFVVSLNALTGAMALMVGTMVLLAATGALEVAIAGMIAFGAAVLLIGGGVYLAAEGIGKMAEGFSKISLIDGGLYGFAGGLAAVAESITLIAASLATLANPLSFAGMHTLKGLSEIMSAMGDVTAEEAERVQASFVGIKNAINDIDGVKLSGVAMSLGKINVDVGVPNTQMAYAQIPAFTPASPGRNQGRIGEILIKFNNDMFEDKVVDLVRNEQGEFSIRAAQALE